MNFRKKVFQLLCSKFGLATSVDIDFRNVNHMLVIREDALGDLVVTLPFIRAIKDLNKGMKVTLLLSPRNAKLLEGSNEFDVIETPYRKSGLYLFFVLKRHLKSKVDLLVDPFDQRVSRGLLYYYAILPRYYIGFTKKLKYGLNAQDYRVFSHQYTLDKEKTFFENFHLFFEAISGQKVDLNTWRALGQITLPIDVEHKVTSFYQKQFSKKPIILFHIQGSRKERVLSLDAVQGVLNGFQNLPVNIFISASPSYLQTIQNRIALPQNAVYIYKNTSVLDIVGLVKYSDLVLSVDTSVVHVASVFNKPLFGIYTQEPNRQKGDICKMFFPFSFYSERIHYSDYLNRLTKDNVNPIVDGVKKMLIKLQLLD